MVLILDGKSEIGVYARSNLCQLICLRHLIRSSAVTNWNFLFEKTYFSSSAKCFELSSHISAHGLYQSKYVYLIIYGKFIKFKDV